VSDSRLRDLERRFRETGSSESEMLWFQERLRTGELGEEQAELAAWSRSTPVGRGRPGCTGRVQALGKSVVSLA